MTCPTEEPVVVIVEEDNGVDEVVGEATVTTAQLGDHTRIQFDQDHHTVS